MTSQTRIVLGTSNRGKLAELRALMADLPLELVTVTEVLGRSLDVVEDGATFEANAEKKARAVLAATSLPSLADDSGLEVDALGGAPGVLSARYSGAQATDAENNRALLHALSGLSQRGARFRCVLALILPGEAAPHFARGVCEGTIGVEPRGAHGFGYDPLFMVNNQGGLTMAELDAAAKNQLSHRGRAMAALRTQLKQLLHEGRLVPRPPGGAGG